MSVDDVLRQKRRQAEGIRQAEAMRALYVQEVLDAMKAGEIVPNDVLAWMVIHVSPLPARARMYIADRLERPAPKGRPAERLRDEFRFGTAWFAPGTFDIKVSIERDREAREIVDEFEELRAKLGTASAAYRALAGERRRSEATMRDKVRKARRRLLE